MRPLSNVFIATGLLTAGLLAVGCDDNASKSDGGADMGAPQGDLAQAHDLAQGPDLANPGDMAVTIFNPIMLLEDVATIAQIPMGDAGVQPVPVRVLVTQVVNNDPTTAVAHDYDDRNLLGLGCFADYYNLINGRGPQPDVDFGTVTITGYQQINTLTGQPVPSEINCVRNGTTMMYGCGFGPATDAGVGPDPTGVPFPAMSEPILPGSNIRFQYTGAGPLGTYDSGTKVKAIDTLNLTENLFTIQYDPAADTVLHFTCADQTVDGGVGKCGFEAVLVQLIATSVPVGGQGYPGAEIGQLNCTGVASGGSITIKKEAIAAMFHSSANFKQVMTRVIRGSLPPSNEKDSKGNKVTVATGRGLLGFAAK